MQIVRCFWKTSDIFLIDCHLLLGNCWRWNSSCGHICELIGGDWYFVFLLSANICVHFSLFDYQCLLWQPESCAPGLSLRVNWTLYFHLWQFYVRLGFTFMSINPFSSYFYRIFQLSDRHLFNTWGWGRVTAAFGNINFIVFPDICIQIDIISCQYYAE